MKIDRRTTLAGVCALGAVSTAKAAELPFAPTKGPRNRVLMVNDLGGDFDGLFAAAHAVMSPSIDLRALISTNAKDNGQDAARGMALGQEMLRLMHADKRVPLVLGAAGKITAPGQPVPSVGTQWIINEALRTDTRLPLFVAVGGGLTEVASALMLRPEIARKMTVVWIGGGTPGEYNFLIDPLAARHVFNETEVPIWQVGADLYADCQVSMTELQAFVKPCGAIGRWLYQQALGVDQLLKDYPINPGETWSMGDSPLVLLTALGDFVGRVAGSTYDSVATPTLTANGAIQPRDGSRRMRVYKTLDTRLMFMDLFAKLKVHAGR